MTGLTRQQATAKQLKVTAIPTDRSGQLNQKKELFYRFKLNRSSNIYLTVSQIAANANVDVQLLSSKKRVLGRSTNPAGTSEFISTKLKQGSYLVRILNKSNVKTGYELKISTSDTSPTLTISSLFAGRGQAALLSGRQLKANDSLQAADQIRYSITQTPHNGTLLLNGRAIGAGGSFTQADINQGRVTYRSTSQGITVLGNGTTPMVSGFNIVWAGPGGSDGGSDNEIFFSDGKTTRQLTQNSVDDKVEGIDGNHVVWASRVGAPDRQGQPTYELFDFNGSTINRLTYNNVNEEFVGVDGANLFWSSPVGGPDQYGQPTYELFYSQNGATRQLTSNSVNEVVGDFQGNSAVWEAAVGPVVNGKASSEIFYFDGNSVRQLTSNAADNQSPRLDQGQIAWSAKIGTSDNGTPTGEIFLFDGKTTKQLTSNSVDDVLGDIKNGKVVWMSRSGPMTGLGLRSYQIYGYDGTSVKRMTTGSGDESIVDFDGTNLLWMGGGQAGSYGQATTDLFFSDGTKITQLTNNAVNEVPAGMSGDQVVWYNQPGTTNLGLPTRQIFYFDGTSVKQLTNNSNNNDYPSFSGETLAWRSTNGTSSQIMRYDLGDSFSFKVSDLGNPASAEQTFNIEYS